MIDDIRHAQECVSIWFFVFFFGRVYEKLYRHVTQGIDLLG